MKWFDKSKLHTVTELRTEYKRLLIKHHPDNGGTVSNMQEINSEYDELYSILSKENNTDDTCTTYNEKATDEAFKAILNEIASYNMTIQIIGEWIWAFDSFAYKDRLKELGFRYAPRKKAWTWHSGEYSKFYRKEVSLNHIRAKYGCQTIRNQNHQYSLDQKKRDVKCTSVISGDSTVLASNLKQSTDFEP